MEANLTIDSELREGCLVRFRDPQDAWEVSARFDLIRLNGNRAGISHVDFRDASQWAVRPIETVPAEMLTLA